VTAPISDRWSQWRSDTDLEEYFNRWNRLESIGQATHGEADFIESFQPASVLDAGCGMGRVAIELARRGVDVVGVDLDDDLLAYARRSAPHLRWEHADLASMDLGRQFDLVAMPGNVMIFCHRNDRRPIVASAAAHLTAGGHLVAGFAIERNCDALTLAEYDDHCSAAHLQLVQRLATWEGAAYTGGDYAVSVHRWTAQALNALKSSES
jgi:2-polyprenyl-3-methyl-5-hydroxy-6-metoxy-1,4-benzoquinol methylase